jgi:hypothetical protein
MKCCSIQALCAIVALLFASGSRAADPRTYLDLFTGHQWSFLSGSEFPGARGGFSVAEEDGKKVGKLDYDFTNGGLYVAGGSAADIPAGFEEFRFRVKSDFWQKIVVRLFDSTDQCHQYEVPYADEGDWQLLRIDLTSKAALIFGGAKDGKIHFPIQKISLAVDKTDSSTSGEVLFSDFMLLK